MTEFWESNFADKKEMWGLNPAPAALLAKDFFVAQSLKNILIPGVGYGRNAKVFLDAGFQVTGIEISQTAIDMAHTHFGADLKIFHGSVTEMPFDDKKYDGIFCYSLIHLLDAAQRKKLIRDCYDQLSDGGYLLFVAIAKTAQTYGQGRFISKDRYEVFPGVEMYFYDEVSVNEEFGNYGLYDVTMVQENYPFYVVKCRKGN